MTLPGPVRWYGGKGNMQARLLPLLPLARVYVEAFGGAAALMCGRLPAPVEVYNDLNGDLANLFRALQSPRRFRVLKRRLMATPYARAEFREALRILAEETNPDERAWAFFTAQNQGFSGKARTEGDWSRVFVSSRGMAMTCSAWTGRLALLEHWHRRFMRVQIDQVDAVHCIAFWDTPETLFYLDPPYAAETRAKGNRNSYEHEYTAEQHTALLDQCQRVAGAVVLSGYPDESYAVLDAAGWERIEFQTACHAAGRTRGSGLQGEGAALAHLPRTEVVWRNPRCLEMEARAKGGTQMGLYDETTNGSSLRADAGDFEDVAAWLDGGDDAAVEDLG